MTKPAPNTAQIRHALNNAFDDPQVDALCLDNFNDIYDKFSRGMRRDEKLTLLLDHCRRTPSGFSSLLDAVRQQYEQSGRKRDELTPLIGVLEAYLGESKIIEEIVLYLHQQGLCEKVLLSQLLKALNPSFSDIMLNILTQQESRKYIEFEVGATAIFCGLTDDGRKIAKDFLRPDEITNTTLDNKDSVPYNLNEPEIQNLGFSWSLDGLDHQGTVVVQRQELLQKIHKILEGVGDEKTAFLYGPARVGKTFLLKRLQEGLPEQYMAVVLNLSGWASIGKLSTFLHELAKLIKIKIEFSQPNSQITSFSASSEFEATIEFSNFIKNLTSYLATKGRILLLMFDELEYLVRKETDPRIFEYLSGCIENYSDQQVRFIFACSGHMVDLVKDGSLAKLWAKGKVLKLSCFEKNISRNLISVLTKPYFSLDTKALELIVQLGNGQPALLRLALPFLVESWKNKGRSTSMNKNDLVDILEEICIELSIELQYIWSQLEFLEQDLLLHLAQYHNRDKWYQGFREDEIIMENHTLMRTCLKRLVRLQILHYSSKDQLYMIRLGLILESLSCGMLSVRK